MKNKMIIKLKKFYFRVELFFAFSTSVGCLCKMQNQWISNRSAGSVSKNKEDKIFEKKVLSTVKYIEHLRSLKHYEKPFRRYSIPEHTSEEYLNLGEKFVLPGLYDPDFKNKLLDILIELNERKQKFELYFLTNPKRESVIERPEGLVLIHHFTFKPEEWKQKKYDIVTLNKILNKYFYDLNQASKISHGFLTSYLFDKESEIILKVLESPKITDTSVSQVINDDLIGELNGKYLFDRTSYKWYQLQNGIWIRMEYEDFQHIVSNFLRKFEDFNIITTSLEKEIFTVLRRKFTLFIIKDLDKRLIPFNNGVFNVETSQLTPYGVLNPKNQRFFFKYNINYDPKAKMSVDFVTWLFKITKRNPLYVNVLRNFFFLLLTRNNGYKTALYLYGSEPEINILLKICEFILTTEGCIFTNLSSLNRVSIRNSLYHVNLIVFKNINFGKQRKSIFKAIINSEPIEFQFGKEYKPKSELNSLVLITSNQVWKSKNTTIDYIIYLPITEEKEISLQADLFKASLPGFINWVLDNPKENLELFKDIRQLNYKIDSYEEQHRRCFGSTLVDPDSLLNLDYFKDYIKPTVGLENNASPFTSKIPKRNFSTTRSSLMNLNNKIILSTFTVTNNRFNLYVSITSSSMFNLMYFEQFVKNNLNIKYVFIYKNVDEFSYNEQSGTSLIKKDLTRIYLILDIASFSDLIKENQNNFSFQEFKNWLNNLLVVLIGLTWNEALSELEKHDINITIGPSNKRFILRSHEYRLSNICYYLNINENAIFEGSKDKNLIKISVKKKVSKPEKNIIYFENIVPVESVVKSEAKPLTVKKDKNLIKSEHSRDTLLIEAPKELIIKEPKIELKPESKSIIEYKPIIESKLIIESKSEIPKVHYKLKKYTKYVQLFSILLSGLLIFFVFKEIKHLWCFNEVELFFILTELKTFVIKVLIFITKLLILITKFLMFITKILENILIFFINSLNK